MGLFTADQCVPIDPFLKVTDVPHEASSWRLQEHRHDSMRRPDWALMADPSQRSAAGTFTVSAAKLLTSNRLSLPASTWLCSFLPQVSVRTKTSTTNPEILSEEAVTSASVTPLAPTASRE